MKIIELTGPTGSGKTTLFPIVNKIFNRNGIHVLSKDKALLQSISNSIHLGKFLYLFPNFLSIYLAKKLYNKFARNKFKANFVSNNIIFYKELREFQMSRKISTENKKYVLDWYLSLGGRYQFYNEYLPLDQLILLDEGFVQKVASLFVSEKEKFSEAAIKRYLDFSPDPFLVINIRTNLEKCKDRLIDRALTPRLQGKKAKEIEDFILNSKDAIDIATRYLTKKGIKIIEINNDSLLDATEKELNNYLLPDIFES